MCGACGSRLKGSEQGEKKGASLRGEPPAVAFWSWVIDPDIHTQKNERPLREPAVCVCVCVCVCVLCGFWPPPRLCYLRGTPGMDCGCLRFVRFFFFSFADLASWRSIVLRVAADTCNRSYRARFLFLFVISCVFFCFMFAVGKEGHRGGSPRRRRPVGRERGIRSVGLPPSKVWLPGEKNWEKRPLFTVRTYTSVYCTYVQLVLPPLSIALGFYFIFFKCRERSLDFRFRF